jgi:hypothetical protein
MKKIVLAGLLFGALNFAQATSVSISAPSGIVGTAALDGTYAYLWSVPLNQDVTSASITFSGITETLRGNGNDISVDVGSFIGMAVGQSSAPAPGNYAKIYDGDALGDAFKANTTGSTPTATYLGKESFPSLNVPETWTFNIDAATLNNYINAGNWGFEIDPDCHFTVGAITFTYDTATVITKTSVPDQATTAGLLGLTFLALLAFRRKLCLN